MRALLIATYEMGRQPFGLASPAAWLRDAGVEVTCVDLARERLRDDSVTRAQLVAFFLPMHMATRLAVPVIRKIRILNPS
ncbi:MAG: CUAEP/CCAEP-tail radical SAM protein, partial [Acidobacteriota bacterium]|nr:CUAEP/CCAEP-tail radical SAM protein [Acidobacteriota bacterium]